LIPQILFSGAVMPFDEMFMVSRAISVATLSRWSFAAAKQLSMGLPLSYDSWLALSVIILVFMALTLYFLYTSTKNNSFKERP
jgi:hypothetical protein